MCRPAGSCRRGGSTARSACAPCTRARRSTATRRCRRPARSSRSRSTPRRPTGCRALSLRWRTGGPLQLRAAASRTHHAADFNQLSPSITLTPNSVNPQLNQGTSGNPALRPLRATNVDLAAEADFGRGHAGLADRCSGSGRRLHRDPDPGRGARRRDLPGEPPVQRRHRPHPRRRSRLPALSRLPARRAGAAWGCRPTPPMSTAAPTTACCKPTCRCRTCRARA